VPTKPCPELVDGMVEFHPDGVASPRDVRIWLDPDTAAEKDGPVVFYWHGTGGEPNEAMNGVGDLGIQEVLDAGGIVVAPTHDPGAGIFPWFLVLGMQQDDLLVADEVLACAQEQIGVDAARIHSVGFSAGALHTAQMSIRRSNYLASVTLYSGGLIGGSMPMFADPDNDFPAMIFHGGNSDVVVIGFKQASADYAAYIGDNGSFSFTCDHGMGHAIPPEQDSVMQFFADHPWGTAPEPYMNALPNGFPAYCMLP
jgi:predicted esterase